MTVLRKVPGRFVAVGNDVARDKRLSFRARGVLVYMLSLPEDSQVSADRIAEQGREGRGAVLTALDELRAAGYYRTTRERVSHGHFQTVTEVSSEPVPDWISARVDEPTESGLPDAGQPDAGEPTSSTKDGGKDETLAGGDSTTLFVVPDPAPSRSTPIRPRDLLFDAIVEVCSIDLSSLTASAKGNVGRVRRELAAVGATAEEIRSRAEIYRTRFRGADLTANALAKHWPSLTPPPAPSRDTWLAAR